MIGGLYGNGMHDFVLAESELGTRVAQCQAAEDADPLTWWVDWLYAEECEARERRFMLYFMLGWKPSVSGI
jgi:hypothetical protein